jgi:hypothetical protein
MRVKLTLTDSAGDIVAKMSEGYPGAINVLMLLFQKGQEGFLAVMDLDDMNIRGPKVWLAYKDYCKQDLDALITAAKERSPEMVEVCNSENQPGDAVAVTGGASFQ